jgi:hypothetical protein
MVSAVIQRAKRAKQSYTERGSLCRRSDSAGLNLLMKLKHSYPERGSVSRRTESALTHHAKESEAEFHRVVIGIQKE